MQDIKAIKEELKRLERERDRFHPDSDKFMRANVRYWAIRWVMEWEKEEDIPKC